MRGVGVCREKMNRFFFHLPVLPPTPNPAERAVTAISLAVASGRNCQQRYPLIWWGANSYCTVKETL